MELLTTVIHSLYQLKVFLGILFVITLGLLFSYWWIFTNAARSIADGPTSLLRMVFCGSIGVGFLRVYY